jgi:ParB family chromosome partitioning protein
MNAPAIPAALAPAAFAIVPIAAFAPSNTRTQERRRRRFPKEKLAELAASIRQVGVIQPLVARPHPQPVAPIRYEIVAGEHRWRAAAMAGLVEINAIVREIVEPDLVGRRELTDRQLEALDRLWGKHFA